MRKVFGLFRKFKALLRYLYNELPEKIETIEQQSLELKRQTEQLFQLKEQVEQMQDLLAIGDYSNPELSALALRKYNSKRQILIIGFYGAYNLGDEMMLQTLLTLLSGREEIHVTLMLSENPDYDAFMNGDVDIIHYCRTVSDFSHLASSFDALIIGGGALLDDRQYQNETKHFLSLSRIVADLPRYFAAKGKPVYFLGVSTNTELRDEQYLAVLSASIQQAKYFSVRDQFSLETMRKVHLPVEQIDVIDDIVMANPIWLQVIPGKEQRKQKRISITWVNYPQMQALLCEIIEIVVERCRAASCAIQIDLVPMYEYHHADTAYFQEAVAKLSPYAAETVHICNYPYTIEGAIACFSQQDAALNIRYHAALLCGCLGIPQTVVVLEDHPYYPNKMRFVFDTFGDLVGRGGNSQSAMKIADEVLQSMQKPRGSVIEGQRVRDNIQKLKQLLNDL